MTDNPPTATHRPAADDRSNPYEPHFDALRLTIIGSRNVAVAVTPSPFPENPGGATLWLQLHLGPLAVALTAKEARDLADWLIGVVDTEERDARP